MQYQSGEWAAVFPVTFCVKRSKCPSKRFIIRPVVFKAKMPQNVSAPISNVNACHIYLSYMLISCRSWRFGLLDERKQSTVLGLFSLSSDISNDELIQNTGSTGNDHYSQPYMLDWIRLDFIIIAQWCIKFKIKYTYSKDTLRYLHI